MIIKALGVGGAFTERLYQTNYVVEIGESKLLIDAGTTLRYSLKASGYKETDITDIFITHLHSDHVGGLEEFAQRCKWIHNHKPRLWIRSDSFEDLCNVVGAGLFTDRLTLEDYFEVYMVYETFLIEDHMIDVIRTDNLHCEGMKSNGLKIFKPNGENVIITGDIANIKDAPFLSLLDGRTVALFHDCSTNKNNTVHPYLFDIIDHYEDVIGLYRIYMIHYEDEANVNHIEHVLGFNFVKQGEEYIIGG